MGRSQLISTVEAKALLGLSTDEDSSLRNYTFDQADRLKYEVRRHFHSKSGFAIQLCVIQQTGLS